MILINRKASKTTSTKTAIKEKKSKYRTVRVKQTRKRPNSMTTRPITTSRKVSSHPVRKAARIIA
jgi:hypothetical protein